MRIISRMPRLAGRTGAAVLAAAVLVGGAAAMAPRLAASHSAGIRRVDAATSTVTGTVDVGTAQVYSAPGSASAAIGPAADGASYQVVCSTTGSDGGIWVQIAGPGGTGYLPAGDLSNGGGITGRVPVCDPASTTKPAAPALSCQQAVAAANQAINQQATNDLFEQFMENLIGNNAQDWGAALAQYGDTANVPAANSGVVIQAIQTASAKDQDITNSLVAALKSVIENGTDINAICVNPGEEIPQQGENDALAYAAQDQNDLDPWLEMALDAVAQYAASELAASA
jgi:hypothetical protein